MEAQEAPHNISPSSFPSSPQAHTPEQNNDMQGQAVQGSSRQEDQAAPEQEELTVKLTIEQEAHKLLLKTTADVSVEMEKGTKAVEATRERTAELLTEAGTQKDAREESASEILHVAETDAREMLTEAETDAKHLLTEAEEHKTVRIALTEAKTFGEFWLKFLNDWTLNFASGLSYNLLMAIFPVIIALAATIGFIAGSNEKELVTQLGTLFPSILGPGALTPALAILHGDAGLLGILSIMLALYTGSRLFVAMENYFAVIYHTPTRPYLRQNLMALVMLLIFILLIPLMLFASSLGLRGFIIGLIASLLLFQAIYVIVPNQRISLRNSWRGTLVAAVALQVYIAIFPLYSRHLLGTYTGNIGFAVILLLFFYYFAIILLIGAEVNAFYSEDVRARPKNIAAMVHQATLEADKEILEQLAQQKAARQSMKR